MLWASVGVPLHSFRLRGSLATPSPPRRSTPEALGRRARRRSRTRRGPRDRSRRCSSRYALVPSRITTEVAGRAVYQGDQFVHGHRVRGCLRLEPKALASLARLRHHAARRRTFARSPPGSLPTSPTGGRHVICRAAPRPPRPGPPAASVPSSREVKGTARGTGAPVCAAPRHGAGRVRGRGIAPIMAPVSLPGLARGLHIMIIDRETFTELAVHLKLASDAILKTARHLTVLSNGDSSNEEQWAGTLDSLMA